MAYYWACKAGRTIILEDRDYETLQSLLKMMRRPIIHKDLIKFADAIEGAEDYAADAPEGQTAQQESHWRPKIRRAAPEN